MILENDVIAKLLKVESGELDEHLTALDCSPFGLFLPIYADGECVKSVPMGYSQVERNLEVTVQPAEDLQDENMEKVAWIYGQNKPDDSKCNHPGTGPFDCSHCTDHQGNCRHCTGHPQKTDSVKVGIFDAPELDYGASVEGLSEKHFLLRSLSKDGFGLTLLHGHSDRFKFTQLPRGYVSVVSNGRTDFRLSEEVAEDKTFVPNMWRSVDGRFEVAGGLSCV